MLCRVVLVAIPMPRAVPHHKWMETSISFDAFDYPKNMAGAGQLWLVISPTIANVTMYHILIDGRIALNLISLATFQTIQIPMSKLTPSCLFSGVGPDSIIPRGRISLPVTFGTPKNYHTESVVFDVMEVNFAFNAIISRPTLYQFMVVAHYGYLVLRCHRSMTSSRSTEFAPPMLSYWRSSMRWRRPRRLLLALASETRHSRAHASMSHLLHPMCSHWTVRTSS
jgi:hypothetical protein